MPAKKVGPAKAAGCFFYRQNRRPGKFKNSPCFPERKQTSAGGLSDCPVLPKRLVLLSEKKKQGSLPTQKEKQKKAGKSNICRCQKENGFSPLGNFGEEKPRCPATVPHIGEREKGNVPLLPFAVSAWPELPYIEAAFYPPAQPRIF